MIPKAARRAAAACLALLAVVLLAATPAGALTRVAPSAPRRIASLNLAADEILAEILPMDRLVAVTAQADDPEMSNVAGHFPRSIVRFRKADLERLIALQPDLVIVSEYTDADFLRLLERTGLSVHRMTGLASMAGIRQAIVDLGRAVGEQEPARRLAERFDARLSALSRLLAGAPRPRVLYWSDPFTAGGDTAIGALIECGGGVNLARELGLTGIQPIGAERAFSADPDAILLGFKDDEAKLRGHPLLSTLSAVRRGRIVHIPPNQLATLSQHAADSCWAIARALHPDLAGAPAP